MISENLISIATLTLAQAEGAAPNQPSLLTGLLPMILLFVGFWFLIIAPQRKKQKKHEKMVAALQKGDEIITTGGVYATIANIKDDRLTVKIADGVRMDIMRNAVTAKVSEDTDKDASKK